jgi:hypothetical protein
VTTLRTSQIFLVSLLSGLGVYATAADSHSSARVSENSSEHMVAQEWHPTDLKFRELFALPVGPRGLELSKKAISLAGQRVRLVGYIVREEKPIPGVLILAPLPISIGDEDEALANDLPPSAVFVHFQDRAVAEAARQVTGPVSVEGMFSMGPHDESDGHVSTFRIDIDSAAASAQRIAIPTHILTTSPLIGEDL